MTKERARSGLGMATRPSWLGNVCHRDPVVMTPAGIVPVIASQVVSGETVSPPGKGANGSVARYKTAMRPTISALTTAMGHLGYLWTPDAAPCSAN